MSNRLTILKRSLDKKKDLFNEKLQSHMSTVKQANGQPLNNKRNGQATLNKWERQNQALVNIRGGIEKTERAIEMEESKIKGVEVANTATPSAILSLIASGDLIQWRKYPNTFFVTGVDKGRIVWDNKKKVVAHRYYSQIPDKIQKSVFAKIYNDLNRALNDKTLRV